MSNPATPTPTTTVQSVDPFFTLLNNSVAANDCSNAIGRARFGVHSIQVINPGGAGVAIWVSNDGVNWFQYGATITAAAFVQLAGLFAFICVNRDSTTTAVTVTLYSGQRDIE
jgi:hypothetical protein